MEIKLDRGDCTPTTILSRARVRIEEFDTLLRFIIQKDGFNMYLLIRAIRYAGQYGVVDV